MQAYLLSGDTATVRCFRGLHHPYLEDLFVDAAERGAGAGKALIDALIDEGKREGWSKLYWVTRMNNPARKLYDHYGEADDYVRYRISL
ncbi:GNAT family N-acetyltransferase [Enterobacter hormaechei]|uniref:GNAT family N-acetyltransferase n=1 Tax=Enterobacter hormaechei TaxID=158836 RepID=UPI003982E726